MSPSPHQMNIGWLVLSKMRSAVRKLCGQVSGSPSALPAQSYARVSAPISPPPARKSAEVGLLIFNIGMIAAKFSPICSRNLTACRNACKHAAPPPGSKIFFKGGTKRPVLARAAAVNHPCEICGLIFRPQAPLFHEARGRQRARDDRADVDRATPRLTGGRGMVIERRP